LWGDVNSWWRTRFDPRAPKKNYPAQRRMLAARTAIQNAAAPAVASAPSPRPAEAYTDAITAQDLGRASGPHRAEAGGSESLEEVVTTGPRAWFRGLFGLDRERINDTRPIEVDLADWNSKRPYLQALNEAAPGEVDRVITAQEARHGTLPAFYFDVAEWLFRQQRVPEAIEMLLSALELPAQDTQTLALVADRLKRYGALDRAIWIYEHVARQEPHRPQPRRNLALALAERGMKARGGAARADLERAMALLTEVIMTPLEDDYEGFELVALMDANALIPRLRATGSRKVELDPRLIALLDVDLRVIIEWNTPGTDMDLWVDQPDDERSIYSNPLTEIGGQLSNDMTSGYGPEQYLLRRAIDGEYAISVDVYSTDSINPNGATMVTAHLTRNYGRSNQKTETMELELKPGDEGELLIGKFRVGGRSGQSP